MDKIVTPLLDGLAKGDLVVVFVVIAIALIFNISNIYRFVDDRKKSRIGLIRESLASDSVTDSTRKFMDKLLEQEYFKSATGIYLEKEAREALIKAHEESKGELKFKHFKRAIPYITYKNSVLVVNVDWFSLAGAIYSFTVGFIAVILALFFTILPVFARGPISQILSMYGIAIFLGAFGSAMLIQVLPVISAKHVQKRLKSNLDNQNQAAQ